MTTQGGRVTHLHDPLHKAGMPSQRHLALTRSRVEELQRVYDKGGGVRGCIEMAYGGGGGGGEGSEVVH